MNHITNNAKPNIRAFVMDVDGTLTDGKIYMFENGKMMKDFNIKDGYSIVKARKLVLIPIIMTGRSSEIVAKCCKELGISILHQGISDKLSKLKEVAAFLIFFLYNIAYIGDDLNGLDCMKAYGFSAFPADTISQLRECVDYICQVRGGEGAVREMLDNL